MTLPLSQNVWTPFSSRSFVVLCRFATCAVAHKHSVRHNLPRLRLFARQAVAPSLFARQHTKYAKGLVDDFKALAKMHPDKRLFASRSSASRFRHIRSRHRGSMLLPRNELAKSSANREEATAMSAGMRLYTPLTQPAGFATR